jgi:hypothetical protein
MVTFYLCFSLQRFPARLCVLGIIILTESEQHCEISDARSADPKNTIMSSITIYQYLGKPNAFAARSLGQGFKEFWI